LLFSPLSFDDDDDDEDDDDEDDDDDDEQPQLHETEEEQVTEGVAAAAAAAAQTSVATGEEGGGDEEEAPVTEAAPPVAAPKQGRRMSVEAANKVAEEQQLEWMKAEAETRKKQVEAKAAATAAAAKQKNEIGLDVLLVQAGGDADAEAMAVTAVSRPAQEFGEKEEEYAVEPTRRGSIDGLVEGEEEPEPEDPAKGRDPLLQPVRQPLHAEHSRYSCKYLYVLYTEAVKRVPSLEVLATTVAEAGGLAGVRTMRQATVKRCFRCITKAFRRYGGDFSRVCDILRVDVIFRELREMNDALAWCKYSPDAIHVLRTKDRISPGTKAATGGYRDYQLLVEVEGLVCEIQLRLDPFANLQQALGDRLYKWYELESLAAPRCEQCGSPQWMGSGGGSSEADGCYCTHTPVPTVQHQRIRYEGEWGPVVKPEQAVSMAEQQANLGLGLGSKLNHAKDNEGPGLGRDEHTPLDKLLEMLGEGPPGAAPTMVPHGLGLQLSAEGRYDGRFVRGVRAGYGQFHYADGTRIEGRWEGGLPHGTGSHFSAEGIYYNGEFRKGKRQGRGFYFNPDHTLRRPVPEKENRAQKLMELDVGPMGSCEARTIRGIHAQLQLEVRAYLEEKRVFEEVEEAERVRLAEVAASKGRRRKKKNENFLFDKEAARKRQDLEEAQRKAAQFAKLFENGSGPTDFFESAGTRGRIKEEGLVVEMQGNTTALCGGTMRQNTGTYAVQFRVEGVRPLQQGVIFLGICSRAFDPNRYPQNQANGYTPQCAAWCICNNGRLVVPTAGSEYLLDGNTVVVGTGGKPSADSNQDDLEMNLKCPKLEQGDVVRFKYDSNSLTLSWWHNTDEQPPIRIEPREHLCFCAGHQFLDEFMKGKVSIV
jgi:hypothetical protein